MIIRECGRKAAEIFLANRISSLVMFFNIGKTMDVAQVGETVKLILTDSRFTELRPDEFEYCFNQIKTGARGKIYDRIDGAIIFESLNLYLQERESAIYQMNLDLKNSTDNVLGLIVSEAKEKNIDIKIEPKNRIEPIEYKTNNYKPREKSKEEILIAEWSKEFDVLYSEFLVKNPKTKNVIRFVPYNDKMINESQYLQEKLEEYLEELKKIQNGQS